MSGQENELIKALAENGDFDAEKARRLGSEVGAGFDARLKKAARRLWLSKMVGVVLVEFALFGLCFSYGTKSLIGFATLLIVVAITAGTLGNRALDHERQNQPAERDEAHAAGASWATQRRHRFCGAEVGRYWHVVMVRTFLKGKCGMARSSDICRRSQRSRSVLALVAWRNLDR